MAMLGFGAGFNFSGYRDVFECSTCDDGVLKLTKLLGWNVSCEPHTVLVVMTTSNIP